MIEETVNSKNRRCSWVAVVFSLVMPGVGHIYSGKLIKGFLLAFIYCIVSPIFLVLLAHLYPNWTVIFTMSMFAVLLGIGIIAAIDSYRIAKSTDRCYKLKDYNRWYLYVLLGVIIQGSCLGHLLHIRAKYFEAFIAAGNSCYPTIMLRDRLFTNKVAYKNTEPQRGDLVILNPPAKWRNVYMKRIVAIEGDKVERKNYKLYINGQKLHREKLALSTLDKMKIKVEGNDVQGEVFYETNGDIKYRIFLAFPAYGNEPANFGPIEVPKHHCFVLGDNRNRSLDSFNFGSVPLATIKGRIEYLYWPAKDWSRFGKTIGK
jgi:signal peptidase I